jgi:hydrogenase/urease accessory protein HupE
VSFIAVQGGNEGKQFALTIVLATLVTLGLHSAFGVEFAQPWVLTTDFVVLLIVGRLAFISQVHWPIWFCGFHSVSVASGFARFAIPTDVPTIYTNFAGFWAVPALIAVVVGVLLDRRADPAAPSASF